MSDQDLRKKRRTTTAPTDTKPVSDRCAQVRKRRSLANRPRVDPPPRDELMLKVLLAIDTSHTHAIQIITQHRSALFSLLQQRRRAPRNDDLASALVHDALIVRAEADLRWLDLCESRIQRASL